MVQILVPPGTEVGVMRHGESDENKSAGKKGPKHDLTDFQKLDASLSCNGMVQGFVSAKPLLKRGFKPDVIAHSGYRRSKQTMEMMLFSEPDLKPSCILETESLDEQHHWQSLLAFDKSQERQIMEEVKNLGGDIKDFFDRYPAWTERSGLLFLAHLFSELDKLSTWGKMPPAKARLKNEDEGEKPKSVPVACLLHKLVDQAIVSMVLFNWEQSVLPRMDRRKREGAEKLLDVVKRLVMMIWRLDELVRPPYNYRRFLFITHSKVCVAAFMIFGGMRPATVEKILHSEGPPFPPNGSMTFYKEKNGILVRDGRINRLLPPLFRPNGRLLELTDSHFTRSALHREMELKGAPALFGAKKYFAQPSPNASLHAAIVRQFENVR